MSSNELDRLRKEVIEKIKRAFPLGAPFDWNLTNDSASEWHSEQLIEMLAGKNWLEVVTHPGVVYSLTDVDFVWALTGEAHFYFLPALLVATLQEPLQNIQGFFAYEAIRECAAGFSISQLKAAMAYLEYWDKFRDSMDAMYDDREYITDTYLRLSKFLDEHGSRAKRDE